MEKSMNEKKIMEVLKLRKEIKEKLEEIDKLVGKINAIIYIEEMIKKENEKEKPLDLTNHAPQILREFFKKKKEESTYTATDLYEVLEMSEKKFKEKIKLAIEGLFKEIKIEKERYKEIKEVIAGLCLAEEKIKKWFPDIFKEKNEKE